jgi:hypothetical protein
MLVMSLAVGLVPAAGAADAVPCPDDNPLGAWMRYQTTYHFRPYDEGCDIEATEFLNLDMVQDGPRFTRAAIEATLPPSLNGPARGAIVQQMLNQAGKHALLDGYHVSRLRYQLRRSACVADRITGIGPAAVSGALALGEATPQGVFRMLPATATGVGYVEFKAMSPEIDSLGRGRCGEAGIRGACRATAPNGHEKTILDRWLGGLPRQFLCDRRKKALHPIRTKFFKTLTTTILKSPG